MRVISGRLKGRTIKGYDIEGTRPTMDRVKESVFAMIQESVYESVVLDLFSGSGNLGIEAISNGARKAYFNDSNRKCTKNILNNLYEFNILDKGFITTMDYLEALNYYKNKNISFDLVFLDPPYKEHIINEILDIMYKYNLLNNNALIVCELSSNERYDGNWFMLYKERKYGDKNILIYKIVA